MEEEKQRWLKNKPDYFLYFHICEKLFQWMHSLISIVNELQPDVLVRWIVLWVVCSGFISLWDQYIVIICFLFCLWCLWVEMIFLIISTLPVWDGKLIYLILCFSNKRHEIVAFMLLFSFLCSVTCILRWASYNQNPTCPQCKHPFEFLNVHRSLDGR